MWGATAKAIRQRVTLGVGASTLAACGGTVVAPGGLEAGGGAFGGTAEGGLPFVEVAKGHCYTCPDLGRKDVSCVGAEGSEGAMACCTDVRVALVSSQEELDLLFAERLLPELAPRVDFHRTVALASYSNLCSAIGFQLSVERIDVADSRLELSLELTALTNAMLNSVDRPFNIATVARGEFDGADVVRVEYVPLEDTGWR